ncbi:TonB-dependent receptor [Pseudoalteromonas fenneropenaei]|uniref:TonB-dependent receptor n=1 Tax=Pseudoalteromonas fenneropenaei TaxID=1737459 RepID=A0ABV7CPI5_9GAMM
MNNNNRKTGHSALALAIYSALASSAVYAEEADGAKSTQESIEVVEVKGIRSSIKESLFLKQNATAVVDLVVADDIGKFPDENLAEALQRIPGITITRNGGEGQKILVRGMGSGYNVTTLNGRKLASEDAGRDFNYDTIASELVNVLKVYKSPEARLIEGGIGAIIDIETRKPLALDGFTVSASAKGIYESRTKDTNPHASFIIGDKLDDDTFGVLFSAVYSKKTLREDSYSAAGFFDEDEGWGADSAGVPVDTNNNGKIDSVDEIFASKIPSYMYFTNAQDTRTRLGATLALQWRPSDQLDVNFDALYSRYNTDGHKYQIGFVNYDESWTPGTPLFTNAEFDELNRVVAMRQSGDATMVELLNLSEPRKTDTYQIGLNTVWHYSPSLKITADLAYSEAKNQNAGDNRFIVARGFVDSIDINYNTGNLLPDVTLAPGLTADQDYGAHYSLNSGTGVTDKVTDLKLFAQYLPESEGLLASVDFGVSYIKQSKGQNGFRSSNPSQFSRGGFYLNRDGYQFDNSSVFNRGEFELFKIPTNVFVPANFDNFLDGENSVSPEPWPSFDYDKLLAYFRSLNSAAADKSIVASVQKADTYEVSEAVTSAFVQANLQDTIADMPFNLNLGLRASKTTIDSMGYLYNFDAIVLDDANKPSSNEWQKTTYVTHSDDYTSVLPSMNFKLNIEDDLVFRSSVAKVLSRPALQYLRIWAAPNFTTFKEGLPTLSMGNPGVEPEKAVQADFTLEWYHGDTNSISGGLFFKDIESFISKTDRAITLGQNSYYASVPTAGQYGAKVSGAEFALSQSFDEYLPEPFNGFGVQFNYTYVKSNYDDPELKAKGLPFQGMSKNSYNAVVYYEQYGFQARLAYNWRSRYLVDPEAWGGPAWIKDYGQLDASASYDIYENISIFAEASNLTNNRHWGYVKRDDQVSNLERFGTQIALGIRGSF